MRHKRWWLSVFWVLVLHALVLAGWYWAQKQAPNKQFTPSVVIVPTAAPPMNEVVDYASHDVSHDVGFGTRDETSKVSRAQNKREPTTHPQRTPSVADNRMDASASTNPVVTHQSSTRALDAKSSKDGLAVQDLGRSPTPNERAVSSNTAVSGAVKVVDCLATVKSAGTAGVDVPIWVRRTANGQAQFIRLVNQASDAAQYAHEIQSAVKRIRFAHIDDTCVGVQAKIVVRIIAS